MEFDKCLKKFEKALENQKNLSLDRDRTRATSTSCAGGAGSIPVRGEVFLAFEALYKFLKVSIEFLDFFIS